MTLPALENGPYVFSVNNKYTESTYTLKAQRAWLELKNALVSLGGAGTIWDVVASSNSVDVKNISDSSPHDLWDDVADIVGGTGNHSWIILENQTTGGQLCLDLYVSTEEDIYIYYSYGGLYSSTDGSISSRPSCSEEATIRATSNRALLNSTNNLTCVVNVMCSADHKTTRMYIHERNVASGELGGFYFAIEEMVNTPSQWIATHKTVVTYNNYSTYLHTDPTEQSPTADEMYYRTYVKTAGTEGWYYMVPTCECFGDLWSTAGYARPLFQITDELEIQGGPAACPIGLYRIYDGAVGGSWGRFRDIFLGQATHPALTVYPVDNSRAWIKFGCFVVPWDGSIPVDALT